MLYSWGYSSCSLLIRFCSKAFLLFRTKVKWYWPDTCRSTVKVEMFVFHLCWHFFAFPGACTKKKKQNKQKKTWLYSFYVWRSMYGSFCGKILKASKVAQNPHSQNICMNINLSVCQKFSNILALAMELWPFTRE